MGLPIKIKLADCFFEREVRCGYEVTEKHKKIWAVHLDLYRAFSELCEEHDIHFQVAFGTLIGAVRHKGFIPWDDDFDVWMDRENYEKLQALDTRDVMAPYFLQTPLSDRKYFTGIVRFRNSLTTGAIKGLIGADYNNGIYIDVYVMDGLSDSLMKCKFQWLCKMAVIKLIQLKRQKRPRSSSLKDVLFFCLKPVSLLLNYSCLVGMYDRIIGMWNGSSTKLSYIVYGDARGKSYSIPKEDIKNTIMLPFEDTFVPAPSNYDSILKGIYGDYMKFPPREKRGTWHEGVLSFEPEIPYKVYFSK